MVSKGIDSAGCRGGVSTRRVVGIFAWICIYRLANAWMIRTQFDPDEYWQTLEPAYCLVFGSENTDGDANATAGLYDDGQRVHGCALTWEWTRSWTPPASSETPQSTNAMPQRMSDAARTTIEQALQGPVRSYVSILPMYWYYLGCRSLFRWAHVDGDDRADIWHDEGIIAKYVRYCHTCLRQGIRRHATYLVSKGPAFLHAILVAAPTDLAVWLIAHRMNDLQYPAASSRNWPFWALMCSMTSWFNGYALVRTYANSVEAVCLLVGIALLGPEIFGHTPLELRNEESKRSCHHGLRAKLAFVLGGLSACVRFTSLAAWVPVGLIISLRSGAPGGVGSRPFNLRNMLQTLIRLCATYGFVGVIIGCCVDRWFYGFWAIPILGNVHFNVLLGNGSLYGTHPFLWYFYAGIPTICGIMLPFFLLELATIKQAPQNGATGASINPRIALVWIIISYVALHSFSAHKEFRFLLPILPLICILAGHAIARLAGMDGAINDGRGFGSRDGKEKQLDKISSGIMRLFTSPRSLLAILVILNYPHLLYLGVIHQRGPIAVNRYLASAIKKRAQTASERNLAMSTQQYSIHYLMGCHSAPVYSHLHVKNARIRTWHLDCSPHCRSDPEIVCESDAFSKDPLGFVQTVYGISGDDSCAKEDTTKMQPSFIVLMQDDAAAVEGVLTGKLFMTHDTSIRHTVKSISWYTSDHDQCPSHERCHDSVTLFSLIDIHFEHMEVYHRT